MQKENTLDVKKAWIHEEKKYLGGSFEGQRNRLQDLFH